MTERDAVPVAAGGEGALPEAEVWVIRRRGVVLCQSVLGPPGDVIVSSDGTIGGTIFERDDYLGTFATWREATLAALAKASALGYGTEYFSLDDVEGSDDDD